MGRINVTSLIFAEPWAPTVLRLKEVIILRLLPWSAAWLLWLLLHPIALTPPSTSSLPPHIAICIAAQELSLKPHCSPSLPALLAAELFPGLLPGYFLSQSIQLLQGLLLLILAEGAIALSVTHSGGALFAS